VSSLERKLRLRTEFLQWLYDASDGEDDRMQDESDFLSQSDATEAELDALIRHLEGERLVRTFLHLGGLLPAGVELTPMGVLEVETAHRTRPSDDADDTGPLGGLDDASPNLSGPAAALSSERSGGDSANGTSTIVATTNGSEGAAMDERGNGASLGLEDELKVASFVSAFRAHLDRLGLDEDAYAQAFADMNTLEAQLRAPHPHLSVVRDLSLALHASVRAGTDDEARRAIRWHPLPW
jgi:hypothetical protein